MLRYNEFFEARDYSNDSGADFWGNVGAGILPISKKTGRILIALRSDEVNEPGTWGIFGGRIDDPNNETPEEAAKRELYEESGHKDILLKMIPSYIYEIPGFKYYNFIGIVKNEFNPILDWETEDYKWVTFDELNKIRPKHFGLEALLKNSFEEIKKYSK
jgi:8-oxo-dGTP pyrophosphatase MutT (NUDIX family)